MEKTNINENLKIGLETKIILNESLIINNNENKNKEYKYLFEEDSFLILKKDHKSFVIAKEQGFIEPYEILIFNVKIGKDDIELVNYYDRCYNCSKLIKFYDSINKLDYKLWKVIKNQKKIENDESCNYNLKKGDILRFGNIKLILREFCTNYINNDNNKNNGANNEDKKDKNENIENNNNRNNNGKSVHKSQNFRNNSSNMYTNYKIIENEIQYTLLLENNPKEKCKICKNSFKSNNDPLIKLCQCEEYVHFNCKKKEMDNNKNIKNEEEGIYTIKTHCPKCKKFIPSHFVIKDKNIFELYQLVDNPFKNSENYLLFEALDFLDANNEYKKYIFYINLEQKFNKKKFISQILIGGNKMEIDKIQKNKNNDKYIFLKIPDTNFSELAVIECKLKEKTLILKNINDTYNTLVLESKYKIKKNEKLLLESGNLEIEASLINENKFKEIKNVNIDKRMEFQKDK